MGHLNLGSPSGGGTVFWQCQLPVVALEHWEYCQLRSWTAIPNNDVAINRKQYSTRSCKQEKLSLLLLPCSNILAQMFGFCFGYNVLWLRKALSKSCVKLSLGPISSAWPVSLPASARAFLLMLATQSSSGHWSLLCCRQAARVGTGELHRGIMLLCLH